jgi:hypothetical protein
MTSVSSSLKRLLHFEGGSNDFSQLVAKATAPFRRGSNDFSQLVAKATTPFRSNYFKPMMNKLTLVLLFFSPML